MSTKSTKSAASPTASKTLVTTASATSNTITAPPSASPLAADFVGYYSSGGTYVPSICDANSIWSTYQTMGRCCPITAQCYFYASCVSSSIAVDTTGGSIACPATSVCATETIFQQFPSVSPLSHIICVPSGYQPRTAYHELAPAGSTSTSSTLSSSSSTSSPPTRSASPSSSATSSSNKGVIIGATVGAVIVAIILAILVGGFIYFRRRISKLSENHEAQKAAYQTAEYHENPMEDPDAYPLVKPYAYTLPGTPRAASIHSFSPMEPVPVHVFMNTETASLHSFAPMEPVELSAVPHHHEAWELPVPAPTAENATVEEATAQTMAQATAHTVEPVTRPSTAHGTGT